MQRGGSARPLAYVATIEEFPGPLAFAVNAEGALLCLEFLDRDDQWRVEEAVTRLGFEAAVNPAITARARDQLLEYCRGERRRFSIPVQLTGTAWQEAVWRALMEIPFGETRTYGQVAASLGRPRAARAMGRANATNPIALVVPCHRVVGANGELTGYGGGLHIKARLLEHEARVGKSAR